MKPVPHLEVLMVIGFTIDWDAIPEKISSAKNISKKFLTK
jgi:hypothetical protein